MKPKKFIQIFFIFIFFIPLTAFSGECELTWTLMVNWTPHWLSDVWGSSGSDVFAVGGGYCLDGRYYPYPGIVLHYNGSTWSSMSSSPLQLNGVWGTSGNDVFTVGSYHPYYSYSCDNYGNCVLCNNIFHYDGTTWSPMGAFTYSFGDVWGSSGTDVFAVGSGGTILHYDGTTWSPMTSGTTYNLNCVWGSSGTDVFAGGEMNTMLHYNGTSWTPMNFYSDWYPLNVAGIWGSSGTDVFAVRAPFAWPTGSCIYHYDGTGWSSMGNFYQYQYNLSGIWGSSGTDVFAVGAPAGSCGGLSSIIHYGESYSISGTVTGDVQAGVTITLSGCSSENTTTDSSGHYSFTVLRNGPYTVTPNKSGYTFTPTSREVTIAGANVTDVNFQVGIVQETETRLVAYFPFNGNANDESGNGNNGAVYGATLTTDRFGNANSAYSFDGNDYIVIADSDSLDVDNAISIVAWAKTSSNSYDQMILEKGRWDNWGNGEYGLLINEWPTYAGKGRFQIYEAAPSCVDSLYPINDGEWHFIVGTWDGNRLSIYVDGQLSNNVNSTGILTKDDEYLTIGSRYGYEDFFQGKIDDIRIYNRALSVAEIQELYYQIPTLITLSSFTATPSDRAVILKWTTESEIDNAGFNIYRAESENGKYVKINGSLIPAEGSATSGATYQYVDNDVKNRTTYYYKLEDTDIYGTSTMHGPVSAEPRRLGRD